MSGASSGPVAVLLVEDNPRHAGLIRDELEIELPSAVVSVATSVAAAREALAQHPRFDAVLLDFRLPDGDGLEVLRHMRAEGRTEPVVFVTTSTSTEIAVEAMKIGAEDYIVKEEGYVSVLPFVVREVIERARLRAERGELERRLARAERLASLNTLMAGIAHNLNNPLTTVRTFLELLPSRYDSDAEFRSSYYKLVLGELERIRVLIGSMMQAVAVPEETEGPWEAAELLRELESYAASGLREKGLRLDARCGDDLPELFAGRESIKQALIILLDNAIAFSPEGGRVAVECRRVQEGDGEGVRFDVVDEGPGVPAADQKRIFDPFFSTRPGGIGIGLFVAHGVARAQGGTLDVRSGEPCGTVFSLAIPAR